MSSVIQFLNKIGCPELRGRFIENGVTDLDVVYHLDHNLIKELIPDLKTRIKFCVGLEKFKKDQTYEVQKVIENAVVVFDEPPPLIPLEPVKIEDSSADGYDLYEDPIESPTTSTYDSFKPHQFSTNSECSLNIINKPASIPEEQYANPYNSSDNFNQQDLPSNSLTNRAVEPQPQDFLTAPPASSRPDIPAKQFTPDFGGPPPRKRTKTSSLTANFDLRTMLQSDIIGSCLLKIYENTRKPLDTRCQGYLCDLLVVYFLNRADDCRLKNEDLESMADSIVEVFKHECKETYYIPPVSKRDSFDRKSGISKGKLVDKYRNKSSFIRHAYVKSGEISDNSYYGASSTPTDDRTRQSRRIQSKDLESPANIDDEAKNSQDWLQFNREPTDFVEFHWNKSRQARKALVRNYSLKENLDMWPILKGPLAPKLIDMDFDELFPNKLKNLIQKWDTFISDLFNLEKQRLTGNDTNLFFKLKEDFLNQNSRQYIEILLFNVMVAPKSKIRNVSGKISKSTITDAQVSMIDHFVSLEDKDRKISEKRETMSNFGLDFHPFVLTQGPNIEKIDHVYVIAEDACFLVPTVLKGLDICFKMYHVLGQKYPPQSQHIWLLIQWAIYEIHAPYDKKIPYVISFLNKLQNR